MLGWLHSAWKSPVPVGTRLADALIAGAPDAWVETDRLTVARRLAAIERALTLLSLDDRHDLMPDVVRRLAALDPGRALPYVSDLGVEGWPEAEAFFRAVLDGQPRHVFARTALVGLLADAGRLTEALAVLDADDRRDPALRLSRARLLLDLDRAPEALAIAREVRAETHAELKHQRQSTWAATHAVWTEATALDDALTRGLEGAEGAIRRAVQTESLLPDSGVNHTLVGQGAMATSGRVAAALALADPEAAYARAAQALDHDPTDRAARVRLGEAALRLGHADEAERVFKALLRDVPGFFPAHLGLGAALDARRHRWHDRVRNLPFVDLDPAWGDVVVDLPVLTGDERRVVALSLRALSPALPALRARGAKVHLLPVDVRPTDLPAFAGVEGVRLDSRMASGVGGIASTTGVACARVETLLDVTGQRGFTFAHEAAHLALWHLDADRRAEVEALHRHALAHPWTGTPYQLQDVDEFFAVAHEEWIAERLDLPTAPLKDDLGVVRASLRLFDGLAGLG